MLLSIAAMSDQRFSTLLRQDVSSQRGFKFLLLHCHEDTMTLHCKVPRAGCLQGLLFWLLTVKRQVSSKRLIPFGLVSADALMSADQP